MNLESLKEPFAPSDVSWRIGQAGKKQNGDIWAKVLAYIDNRNIQERLDSVCGPENWWNCYTVGPGGGVLCGITIRTDKGEVTKWDGAENSDIEPVKGGLSDSMKRAAVQWGIGRYLYELGENWAEIVDQRAQGSRYANCKIKVKGVEEWAQFYWLPPRDVLPEVAKARAVAEQHGLTTGDKVPPPPKSELFQRSELFQTALDKISMAVAERDVDAIARILNVAEKNHAAKHLTDNEHKSITHECTLALRKIKAMEKEPVGA